MKQTVLTTFSLCLGATAFAQTPTQSVDTAYNFGSIAGTVTGLLVLGWLIKSMFTKKK